MKNYLLLFFLSISYCTVLAQKEKANYASAAKAFEEKFNSENYQAIFESFSPEMQNALPINKTIAFLGGLMTQSGKIIQRDFVKYEQSYASYKTVFERATWAFNISVDNNSKINGFLVKPFVENKLPKPTRNTTKLDLPFEEEWTVTWGGDTKELNYHVESEAQKNAFDLVITDQNGSSHKNTGSKNEDYYAFGKKLLAPCDAEVVLAVDGIKDNTPGTLNPIYVPGNTVILKTANNEYLFYANFKQNSIVVKEGQKVNRGELLGLCGNSGNSSEPHLHFHIQNVEDMNIATGVKCYFENLSVNGETKTDYSPIKKDKISNSKK